MNATYVALERTSFDARTSARIVVQRFSEACTAL
jgi:hypothetical protein